MFSRNLALVSTYTRKQAIEDGVLVDVTDLAKEKGFICNVCLTAGVMAVVNNIPDKFNYQDGKGRLWDLLNALYFKACKSKGPVVNFKVHMPHMVTVVGRNEPDRDVIAEEISLISLAGPGDNNEIVITIMLPGED